MPTMAAVESLLDFLWTGATGGGGNDGDGAGDGKNGLHDGNGRPHRSKFPVNADWGNFDRVAGIEPLRLLFETLKSLRLSGLMLGRLPENLLFSKNRPVKCVKLLTSNGILPEKLLEERSSRVKRFIRVTLGGNPPENWLLCK